MERDCGEVKIVHPRVISFLDSANKAKSKMVNCFFLFLRPPLYQFFSLPVFLSSIRVLCFVDGKCIVLHFRASHT